MPEVAQLCVSPALRRERCVVLTTHQDLISYEVGEADPLAISEAVEGTGKDVYETLMPALTDYI